MKEFFGEKLSWQLWPRNATKITPHNRPDARDLLGGGVQSGCLWAGMKTAADKDVMANFIGRRGVEHVHRENQARQWWQHWWKRVPLAGSNGAHWRWVIEGRVGGGKTPGMCVVLSWLTTRSSFTHPPTPNFFFNVTQPFCVAWIGFELLVILLPQFPECWDTKHTLPLLVTICPARIASLSVLNLPLTTHLRHI